MADYNACRLRNLLIETLDVLISAQRIVESVASGRTLLYDFVEEYHRRIFTLQDSFGVEDMTIGEFLQEIHRQIHIQEEPAKGGARE